MRYICLLLLMFSAGCVTTANSTIGTIPEVESVAQPVLNSPEPPDWILGRGHKQFTHAQYLVGIGFSEKNTVSASESARSELSKNIRFKIASVMKDYNSNDGSFIESFVTTETDALLEGVQIKDGWFCIPHSTNICKQTQTIMFVFNSFSFLSNSFWNVLIISDHLSKRFGLSYTEVYTTFHEESFYTYPGL